MSTRAYLRSSLAKQELSPLVQRQTIDDYCRFHKVEGPIIEYLDQAVSSKHYVNDRPAGGKLMRDLRKGDTVIIAKDDRMFRSAGDCIRVCEQFVRYDVNLVIISLGGMVVDLKTPAGKVVMTIMAAVAEFGRDITRERTRDTVRYMKRQGLAVGRPNYGFKHKEVTRDGEKVNIVVPDPSEREVMAMLANWRRQRWSYKQIHEKVNYDLKLKTRDGKEWDLNRIRRAIKAELLLQLKELGSCVADSH